VAAIVLVALLLYFFGGNGGPNYSWREHYEPAEKDPYGTYFVRNLLEEYYPGQRFEVVSDSLGERLDSGSFVYIGDQFWLDSASINELLDFVAAGNQAFIACPYLPYGLLDSLGGFECVYYEDIPADSADFVENDDFQTTLSDTMVSLNFQHPALHDSVGFTYKYYYLREPIEHIWEYFPQEYLCDSQSVFATLGLLNDEHVNFLQASYGDGEFYLHATPLAFTNINLMEKKGLEYASKAFSHLRPGPIYWDERKYDPPGFNPSRANKNSPLRYILSQRTLAWAWYVLLGLAVAYLVFRAKRRQRVIPVLEQNTNTSLEFIGTIGRLFFLQNNHRQLAAQKMRLFLIFVRERYHLPTKELNEQFAMSLATRSSLPQEHIQKILNLHQNISNSSFLSDDTLVNFHRLMEKFYRECR
jgi:hypothetical protein